METKGPKMWPTKEIFKNLPKVSNRPTGENSPNLITLVENKLLNKTEADLFPKNH
jgi:hypothetical protein